MHEIQMILGNVAALSEPTIPGFVPRRLAEAEYARSLAVIRQDLSAHRGEFCPMLLKAGQHRKIALIQHRTAVPLDIAGARALLLLGSTVLSYGAPEGISDRAPPTRINFFMGTFLCSEGRYDRCL